MNELGIAQISRGDLWKWTDGAKYVVDTTGNIEPKMLPPGVTFMKCSVLGLEDLIERHESNVSTFYVCGPVEVVNYLNSVFNVSIHALIQ